VNDLVGPILDGLLAILLIAALMYGMRLERKLKALRDTQAGFAEAVRSLDLAAARAGEGLETLRRTAEDAHDGLQDRINKARELKTEMERLIARAERASEDLNTANTQALATPRPAPQPASIITSVAPTRTPAVTEASAPRRSRMTFTPTSEEAPLDLTELAEAAPRPRVAPQPAPQPNNKRSVARGVDEDLFETSTTDTDRPRRTFGVRR
jgi:hypothetical protein